MATVLYELSAIVEDDLSSSLEEISSALGLGEYEVERAFAATYERYRRGEITQWQHWEDFASRLGLEDVELFGTYAAHTAVVDHELLGWIRGQQNWKLGLISSATPDFVGQFRKDLELDRLFRVSTVDPDLETNKTYSALLSTAASRLQESVVDCHLVAKKPGHIKDAEALGIHVIDLSNTSDYAAAFRVIA